MGKEKNIGSNMGNQYRNRKGR